MSEELKAALARIACLEGEIAKRDETIVNAAPVSEAKAQGEYGDAYQGAREDLAIWKRRALEAEKSLQEERIITERLGNALNEENGPAFMGEPVLPAKAQGVVMPEQECKVFAARYICNWDGEGDICYALVEKHKDGSFIHIENGAPLIEYKGDKILNLWPLGLAAPVQQVSVPDDDELSDLSSSACQMALANGVGEESFMVLARTVRDRCAMIAAAPAAPAADAGLVEALEEWLADYDSCAANPDFEPFKHVAERVARTRAALAARRAKGVV